MACEFELCLNAGQYAHANREALAALDLVDAVEAQLTIYRDHSQVMEINRKAAAGPVAVEPRLFSLLQQCKQLWEDTAGGFDITSGPLSKVWGFHRRQGSLPRRQKLPWPWNARVRSIWIWTPISARFGFDILGWN